MNLKTEAEHARSRIQNPGIATPAIQVLRATVDDIPRLQDYFDSLLAPSLHTRLFATSRAVPKIVLDMLQGRGTAEQSDFAGVYIAVNRNEPDTVIGEAMLAAFQSDCAPHGSAEIALSTSDQLRRSGVGGLLFDRVITEAISANFNQLFAEAFTTNYAFISLAKKNGFAVSRNPEDRSLVRLSRSLNTSGPST